MEFLFIQPCFNQFKPCLIFIFITSIGRLRVGGGGQLLMSTGCPTMSCTCVMWSCQWVTTNKNERLMRNISSKWIPFIFNLLTGPLLGMCRTRLGIQWFGDKNICYHIWFVFSTTLRGSCTKLWFSCILMVGVLNPTLKSCLPRIIIKIYQQYFSMLSTRSLAPKALFSHNNATLMPGSVRGQLAGDHGNQAL